MTVIDESKARSAQVEAWLDEWAIYVRGRVDLGYPHASPETKAVFGSRSYNDSWPAYVEAIEACMRHMPEQPRVAIKRYYVSRWHVNSIARELGCGQRKAYELLDRGRVFVEAWMRARMAA